VKKRLDLAYANGTRKSSLIRSVRGMAASEERARNPLLSSAM
jgi:hypothetical protein